MQRRTVRRPSRTRQPRPNSLRTRITLLLLGVSTLAGTGLVVAPVAFVG